MIMKNFLIELSQLIQLIQLIQLLQLSKLLIEYVLHFLTLLIQQGLLLILRKKKNINEK